MYQFMHTSDRPFWPSRWWWFALLIILVCAGALRYTGYDFSLPYVDHVDEPAYNLAGRMIIDFGSAKPLGMHGYPPGIVTVNYVLLRFFHDPSTPPSTIIDKVRLLSITFSIGTIIIVALLGYRVGLPLSGLLAAGLWAFSPVIVEHSRYATADNFVTFFTVAAFFLSLTGTHYDKDRWATAGTVAMMFAIMFKYQAVFVLPLILIMPLWRLVFREGNCTRRIFVNLGSNVLILGIFFLWLLVIFPSLEATSSPDWSAPTESLAMPSLEIAYANIREALDPIRRDVIWVPGIMGLALLFWPRFRETTDLFGLVVLFIGAIMWSIGVSFYGLQRIRQFLAMDALFTVLCGVGLSAWSLLLEEGLKRLGVQSIARHSVQWSSVVLIGLIGLGIWPDVRSSANNAYEHTLPDRRNDLAAWADATLAPAPYVGTSEFHKVFNGPWGGYAGQNEFPLVAVSTVTDRSIEEWREQGTVYAIEPYWRYLRMQETPHGQAYLEQMTVLKIYPSSDAYRDPGMVVFRLYPIQYPMVGSLGSIDLVGYDIDRTEVAPGEIITFVLYWQASQPTDTIYSVYNHLVFTDSRDIVAQIDGPPLPGERRPTTTWDDPDEVFVSRSFTLTIDESAPPGDYQLLTGFYQLEQGERLLSPDGEDFLVVTTVSVTE